ncbi:hypothetical protein CFAM422_011206 [Trichoderma lentiforme]|uniref:Uncharacterized protein n=1 Tax=Trichoderma lentiforme TaxID=1567552 RepID=A0A9P4X6S7_9HYPO|nr:hypothetical protein CFAM422_011206 [Trichoderma lentiforme]
MPGPCPASGVRVILQSSSVTRNKRHLQAAFTNTGAVQVLNEQLYDSYTGATQGGILPCQVAPRYLDASGSRAASKPNQTAKRSQPAQRSSAG